MKCQSGGALPKEGDRQIPKDPIMRQKMVKARPGEAETELEPGREGQAQCELMTSLCYLFCRGLKDMELDTSSIEKRFAFGFLQQLLRWMDISQEFIAHLGTDGIPSPFSPFCRSGLSSPLLAPLI